nr:EboA domain-containing protein [Chitinophaga nivalis]
MSVWLWAVIRRNGHEKGNEWLAQRWQLHQETATVAQFNQTFTAIPRFTGKHTITITQEEHQLLQEAVPGFFVQGWTLDRLARVWWLLQLAVTDKTIYLDTLDKLFKAAEMNELAALYSALPLLPWPEEWIARTTEGIRSNIGIVQAAIMQQNPYPAQYLPEPAWNQLVMKAIFTEKNIHLITGLDGRANATLALMLTDFAHERWAAGRTVDPLQWRMLTHFTTAANLPDIIRVLQSAVSAEREAAALVCAGSTYAPAKALLLQVPDIAAEIAAGTLTWQSVADKTTRS